MAKPKFEKNLAQGSVAKQLLLFAIPFIISNFIQSLYSVADMAIVGHFSGTVSMSGVNIGTQVTMLMTNLVIGLSVGGTVLIGQYMGSGQRDKLKHTIGTLFTTLIICALVITAIMVFLKDPILRLIQTPKESFEEASSYLLITALGTIFIFGYNAFSAVMRGMGDSVRPLMFVAVAAVTNILLDLILVAGLNMAATGAAIATVISQAVSMILCIVYQVKNDFVFDFKLSSFRIDGNELKMLLKLGIPSAIQNIVAGLSFMFMTTMVNTLGYVASAAVGAVGKLNSFAIMPAIAISSSVSAMSAQNFGAGEIKRAVKTMRIGILLAGSMSLVVFILVQLFPTQSLMLFSDDESLLVAGREYLRSFSFDYLVAPIMFSLNGLFIGAGHTTFSLINSVCSSVLFRMPAAYLFGFVLDMELAGIGLGAPCASLFSLIVGFIYFISGKWKKMNIVKRNDTSDAPQKEEAAV